MSTKRVLPRSLYKISKRSLGKISEEVLVEDPCDGSPSKISVQAVYKKISEQDRGLSPDLCTRYDKISTGGYLARFLGGQSTCTWRWRCHKSPLMRQFKGKSPRGEQHVLRELAQSKCTWTRRKSHPAGKFTGEILDANTATSVRSQNAHGHVRRATSCGKCRRRWIPPRRNTLL